MAQFNPGETQQRTAETYDTRPAYGSMRPVRAPRSPDASLLRNSPPRPAPMTPMLPPSFTPQRLNRTETAYIPQNVQPAQQPQMILPAVQANQQAQQQVNRLQASNEETVNRNYGFRPGVSPVMANRTDQVMPPTVDVGATAQKFSEQEAPDLINLGRQLATNLQARIQANPNDTDAQARLAELQQNAANYNHQNPGGEPVDFMMTPGIAGNTAGATWNPETASYMPKAGFTPQAAQQVQQAATGRLQAAQQQVAATAAPAEEQRQAASYAQQRGIDIDTAVKQIRADRDYHDAIAAGGNPLPNPESGMFYKTDPKTGMQVRDNEAYGLALKSYQTRQANEQAAQKMGLEMDKLNETIRMNKMRGDIMQQDSATKAKHEELQQQQFDLRKRVVELGMKEDESKAKQQAATLDAKQRGEYLKQANSLNKNISELRMMMLNAKDATEKAMFSEELDTLMQRRDELWQMFRGQQPQAQPTPEQPQSWLGRFMAGSVQQPAPATPEQAAIVPAGKAPAPGIPTSQPPAAPPIPPATPIPAEPMNQRQTGNPSDPLGIL